MAAEPGSRLESRGERRAAGRELRRTVARSSHAVWQAPRRGRDALALLAATDRGRVAELLPIRYGRMAQSPFAFLRGAAAVMAFDLAATAATGIRVQACGDSHLLNFGAFATPERNLIFDINDFDETLPAPWEWDVKRLAASVMVAGRSRQFADRRSADAVADALRAYREALANFARQPVLAVWYAHIDAGELIRLGVGSDRPGLPRGARAHAHTGARLLPRLTQRIGGARRIKDNPPLLYHFRGHAEYEAHVRDALRRYRQSLTDERRALLDRYRMVDIARKVVGVGSVGTRCAVALFMADEDDALFLQYKEARPSVLAPYAGPGVYRNQGERVVVGQRLLQSASDFFLGWSRTQRPAFDFYVRQLRDMKTSVSLDALSERAFARYARLCALALARAHAKAGDAAMISGYLGNADTFDRAVQRFALAYADETERDHAKLVKAVRAGRIRAEADTPH